MSDQILGAISSERLLGHELAGAAERLLAKAGLDQLDGTDAVRLATVQVLLALYWELRHGRAGDPPPALEWVSALLCGTPPADGPGDRAYDAPAGRGRTSAQTTLPSRVGTAPHALARDSTIRRPRPAPAGTSGSR